MQLVSILNMDQISKGLAVCQPGHMQPKETRSLQVFDCSNATWVCTQFLTRQVVEECEHFFASLRMFKVIPPWECLEYHTHVIYTLKAAQSDQESMEFHTLT